MGKLYVTLILHFSPILTYEQLLSSFLETLENEEVNLMEMLPKPSVDRYCDHGRLLTKDIISVSPSPIMQTPVSYILVQSTPIIPNLRKIRNNIKDVCEDKSGVWGLRIKRLVEDFEALCLRQGGESVMPQTLVHHNTLPLHSQRYSTTTMLPFEQDFL